MLAIKPDVSFKDTRNQKINNQIISEDKMLNDFKQIYND